MYFVDRDKIEAILTFMEAQYELLDTQSNWRSLVEQRALERVTQIIIESFLDVGNQVIDGFIMRDPGSYEDIVEILVDERVLDSTEKDAYFALVNFRKRLVQDYTDLTLENLIETIELNQKVWRSFPKKVRNYLESELGPVSAFKPSTKENKE